MGDAHHRYEEDQEYLDFNRKLAARLRAARVSIGLTQNKLGERIGVSKTVLSKSENESDPQKIPAYVVKKYAEISGRQVADFFEDAPSQSKAAVKDRKIENIRKQLTWLSENELDIVYSLISKYIEVRKNH